MDDASKRISIAAHLARAHDDLGTARNDWAYGHWRGAANRAYYAVFHAASAALLWLGIERARHAGVLAAFGEFLIKPGLIAPEFGQIYNRIRQAREMQDYDLMAVPLTAVEVERIVGEVERFITQMESYLHQVGAV